MKPKVIVIAGPTAVGKTEAAVELAEKLGGEIINADAQQVYRSMDIGTGKPGREERRRVPHHLIDVVEPDQEFNAAIFGRLALETVQDISARGRTPIVCGGTGLYIKALIHGLFRGPEAHAALRARLRRELEEAGLHALYERLIRVDPGAVSRIHPHDTQRIVRALEVYEATGRPIGEWQAEHAFKERTVQPLKIGLDRDRAELYERIDRRCERMVEAGLVEEIRALLARGYRLQSKALRSIGYRHIGLAVSGVLPLEDAISLMKRDTRRLAKRQLTWFRADPEIRWFHPEKDRDAFNALAAAFLSR
ncbi:MAG TPA: tRNA (adenosine(37)-N6)-dimethylallyltransferase MiaA [Candidatus Eisenbacteria bacterium]|nr:tRNA (adenosine(37)-N6)-dimethylallyltransferase MiaA [Candidatus Eisenbacteria bacterium]